MDTLTHALNAMLAARASEPVKFKPGQLSLTARSWAGFFAGMFPDSDFITMAFGTTTFLNYHRGITHSFILAPLWAAILAWVFSLISRGRYNWRAFYGVSLLSIVVHIFGDAITNYGTMVLAPFSNYKLAFSTTFIIDWYFTGIILFGLLASYLSKRYKRHFALMGFSLLLCYVVAQGWWQRMALRDAYSSVPQNILQQARVYALAQPVSPFNWKLVVALPDHYYVRYVNLFRHHIKVSQPSDNMFKRVDALYLPRRDVNWELIPRFGARPVRALARRIWLDPAMADIRNFMQFPAVQSVQSQANANCVWFADQRFILKGIRAPFQFGGCESKTDRRRTILQLDDGKPEPLK